MNHQYWLPSHVFACRLKSGAVFLDLRRDSYLSLSAAQCNLIAPLVSQWSASAERGDASVPDGAAAALAEQLVIAGLLSREHPTGIICLSSNVQQRGVLVDLHEVLGRSDSVAIHHIVSFLIAWLGALWSLRVRSLEYAVRSVASDKSHGDRTDKTFDKERAAELVGAFRRLRLYVFTAKGHCLFHALTLVRFLARYDLHPTWVIGVKVTPWGAHSWVQHENLVLDSSPEKVVSYTPILAV